MTLGTILIIALVAAFVGAMLWAISSYESACTGECKQGRNCNCILGKRDE
jgi:hypothetical protein